MYFCTNRQFIMAHQYCFLLIWWHCFNPTLLYYFFLSGFLDFFLFISIFCWFLFLFFSFFCWSFSSPLLPSSFLGKYISKYTTVLINKFIFKVTACWDVWPQKWNLAHRQIIIQLAPSVIELLKIYIHRVTPKLWHHSAGQCFRQFLLKWPQIFTACIERIKILCLFYFRCVFVFYFRCVFRLSHAAVLTPKVKSVCVCQCARTQSPSWRAPCHRRCTYWTHLKAAHNKRKT